MSTSPPIGLRQLQDHGRLRPNIVRFGEMPMHMEEINAALDRCGLFVAVGTSGEVYPAAGFVLQARRRAHAHTVSSTSSRPTTSRCSTNTYSRPATRIVPTYASAC